MQILLADFKDLLFNQMLQAYQVNFKTNEQKVANLVTQSTIAVKI